MLDARSILRARFAVCAAVLAVMAPLASTRLARGDAAVAAGRPSSRLDGAFSARVERDEELGVPVVILAYRDPRAANRTLEARVAPGLGANLYSFAVAGHELLVGREDPERLKVSGGGTPVLFPMPNRVRGSRFTFEGRSFTFEPNAGRHFIHGLVRDKAFAFDQPRASARGAHVNTWLEWDERHEDFARFPIRHRLRLSFALGRSGLVIAYEVENHDDQRLPFGFGLHPWFRVPGSKGDVFISVPATHHMQAEALLPTGVLEPVAGTRYDLRRPVALSDLELDDVFWGVRPARPPHIEWRDLGIGLRLRGSGAFAHIVVYTPDRPVFCLENQTSSTDAHNLHQAGHVRASGLIVVPPGGTQRGRVQWQLSAWPGSRKGFAGDGESLR